MNQLRSWYFDNNRMEVVSLSGVSYLCVYYNGEIQLGRFATKGSVMQNIQTFFVVRLKNHLTKTYWRWSYTCYIILYKNASIKL